MRNGGHVKDKNVKGNTKNSGKKIVIKNKARFMTFIFAIVIVIAVIICIVGLNSKVEIDENTNISELNVEKYSEEIKAEYEQEGKDSKFIEDWNKVQDKVGIYLIENYPTDGAMLPAYITGINETLKGEEWGNFGVEKPKMWNGTWTIDENGNLNFKFASKEIEPNWASTLSDQGYIVLN